MNNIEMLTSFMKAIIGKRACHNVRLIIFGVFKICNEAYKGEFMDIYIKDAYG